MKGINKISIIYAGNLQSPETIKEFLRALKEF